MPRPQRVAVVGAGILGLLIAERMQSLGAKVSGFGLAERSGPATDSQRNHAWKQSGLLYREESAPHVLAMTASGDRLLDHIGLDRPTRRGVFGISSESRNITQFEHRVDALGLTQEVDRLTEERAAELLDTFVSPGYAYFAVPDCPFNEGLLLRRLRRLAHASGAEFYELDRPAHVEVVGQNASVRVGEDVRLYFDVVILAAGAGLMTLSAELPLPAPISVVRSVLLVTDPVACPLSLSSPLFVDIDTGLAIVRHPHADVIGGTGRVAITDLRDMRDHRTVSVEERELVLETLPKDLADGIRSRQVPAKWTAGFKTERLDSEGRSSVAPFVCGPDELGISNLVVAMPGKATLAWYTSESVIEKVLQIPPLEVVDDSSHLPIWLDPLSERIETHFEAMHKYRDEASYE